MSEIADINRFETRLQGWGIRAKMLLGFGLLFLMILLGIHAFYLVGLPWLPHQEAGETRVIFRPDVRSVVGVGAVSLVLALAFTAIIASRVSRPLRNLARAAREVEAGHWEARAKIFEPDEVGHLAMIFNQIVERTQQWHEQLESEVKARTSELREVNQVCQQEVEERRAAERRLQQFVRAVEQSPCSIVITDTQGRIEYVNPKFTQLTGYTAAETLGKNPRMLKSGSHASEYYRGLWQTIATGQEWHGEFHNVKKNGEPYWELASISPIRDASGEVTHFVAVKEDVTHRKTIEAERERLIGELRDALAKVKTLTGLLPICAACKKIRDDQGYWNTVERYLEQHSSATFTHGICPDCAKALYPEVYAQINGKDAPAT